MWCLLTSSLPHPPYLFLSLQSPSTSSLLIHVSLSLCYCVFSHFITPSNFILINLFFLFFLLVKYCTSFFMLWSLQSNSTDHCCILFLLHFYNLCLEASLTWQNIFMVLKRNNLTATWNDCYIWFLVYKFLLTSLYRPILLMSKVMCRRNLMEIWSATAFDLFTSHSYCCMSPGNDSFAKFHGSWIFILL